MTTTSLLRRLLAGLALVVVVGLASATAAGADEPAPAYPPSPGGDEVVEAGQGPDATEPADDPAAEDEADDPAPDADGDDPAADDEEAATSPTGADGAPGDADRGAARVLVLVGTALLLGGGVVAIARRI